MAEKATFPVIALTQSVLNVAKKAILPINVLANLVAHALSFYRSQNVLSLPKKLTAFSASSKPFVPAQKNNFTECKSSFFWHKMFVIATICK